MIIFLDTEFIEDGSTIDLISIGLVDEDGWELYLLNWECDYTKANNWVKENVLVNLPPKPSEPEGMWMTKKDIASAVKDFCTWKGRIPKFWGEWCAYDWVVFCWLFGRMIDLPEGFPMRCNDIIQLAESLSVTEKQLPPSLETEGNHNALLGARSVKERWEWLQFKCTGVA